MPAPFPPLGSTAEVSRDTGLAVVHDEHCTGDDPPIGAVAHDGAPPEREVFIVGALPDDLVADLEAATYGPPAN